MIEVQNNRHQSPLPQEMELDVRGEDGVVFFTLSDPDTGDTIVQVTTASVTEVDTLMGELRDATEEAF